ncbi:MAG: endolytic transglycosylase MltG [Pseudomonadota bacterium]|nr:endolytic transglycosylase MltG [Pseudomonadota bacterium]
MRVLLVILLGIALIAGSAWMEYRRFLATPLVLDESTLVLDVPRGTSLRRLSEDLTACGVLDHPYFFMVLAHVTGDASRIKAGEYAVSTGLTPPELLGLLTSGRVVQRPFTLVEGWTYRQAVTAVTEDERLEAELDDLSTDAVMRRLGYPDEHPEGRFFPDTYHFPKGTSDLQILRRAYETMQRVLAEEWERREEGLPLQTPDEALILASVVEKETGLAPERAQIAGVFVRRLNLGMKLQTDPTVIYGLGESFDGDLRRADLERDTPYNTYVHAGLPPTPISLPGREAIHAVLHPADGDSLYFVAKGDGSHHFSATLAEHNRAVSQYQLRKP